MLRGMLGYKGTFFFGIQRKITFSSRVLFCKYGGTTVIKTILGTGEQLFHWNRTERSVSGIKQNGCEGAFNNPQVYNLAMNTGPWFNFSTERMEEQRLEPATTGLQDQHDSHWATAALLSILHGRNILRKHLNYKQDENKWNKNNEYRKFKWLKRPKWL